MKHLFLLIAAFAVSGCRQAQEPQNEAIAFIYSSSEASKTDILIQGDEIGVFAAVEGTEGYFLDNTKYRVGSDGRSLSTTPAVYYPEAKQAVIFTAYLPFGGTWGEGLGTFSVPSDQSDALSLKKADLCWATASSTPVAAAVPLEFSHLFARLLVTANHQIPAKISLPSVQPSGTLNPATALFALNAAKGEVWTTGTELILPAQTVTRLVLTVAGIEYVFEGAISLESAKTTSINLTLNPATQTATLSGSSTTDWLATTATGNPTHAVSNILTLHWPKCHPQSGSVNKIVLKINGAEYAVSSGIAYADQTFTVPFASAQLRYPYAIEHITLYQADAWLHESANIVGGTVAKSNAYTLGVRQPLNPPAESDYVKVGSLYWAKGNLIAVSKDNNRECKIGAPEDGGLYFQFGSLIGYKGGALANGGSGVGIPQLPETSRGTYWNDAESFSWENEAMVWPSDMSNTPSSWPSNKTTNQWYFGLQSSWSTWGQNIRDYPGFSAGAQSNVGVGDPCAYYIGGTWRLPTNIEHASLSGKTGSNLIGWTTAGLTARLVRANQMLSGVPGPGTWFGSGLNANSGTPDPLVNPFFRTAGYRNKSDGSFCRVGAIVCYWGSSVYSATDGICFYTMQSGVGMTPQFPSYRTEGYPVRCVAEE